jgi:hypothetical protein
VHAALNHFAREAATEWSVAGRNEASFGPGHPNVARDLNNLAQLLADTNRVAEAEPLMRRALAIFEGSLGHYICCVKMKTVLLIDGGYLRACAKVAGKTLDNSLIEKFARNCAGQPEYLLRVLYYDAGAPACSPLQAQYISNHILQILLGQDQIGHIPVRRAQDRIERRARDARRIGNGAKGRRFGVGREQIVLDIVAAGADGCRIGAPACNAAFLRAGACAKRRRKPQYRNEAPHDRLLPYRMGEDGAFGAAAR